MRVGISVWTLDVPVAWKRMCSLGGAWALALQNTVRNWMLVVLALQKRMFWAPAPPWGRSREAQALVIGSESGGAGCWTLGSSCGPIVPGEIAAPTPQIHAPSTDSRASICPA